MLNNQNLQIKLYEQFGRFYIPVLTTPTTYTTYFYTYFNIDRPFAISLDLTRQNNWFLFSPEMIIDKFQSPLETKLGLALYKK